MKRSQSGRVAIVTGGTANLGRLFAEALAHDGADVMVHYNSPRRAAQADDVLGVLHGHGVRARSHQADLTEISAITALVDDTLEHFGRWDILVNTSGVIIRKPLADTSEDDYEESFAVNSRIPFFLMREAFRKISDNGRIINLVTTQLAVTAATYSAYAGSKAPVEHFTKAFAKEIGPRGVTVNCVAPGPQKTDFLFAVENDETIAWLSGMTISGELGDPGDVVPVVRFLAAPEARWVTAQTVYVNGGMIAPIN
jgi:NAD(P)-dependent dehydrogenase (short-subunit alcohol dehydrogenase family)